MTLSFASFEAMMGAREVLDAMRRLWRKMLISAAARISLDDEAARAAGEASISALRAS